MKILESLDTFTNTQSTEILSKVCLTKEKYKESEPLTSI